jgi:hypothetical protein
MRLPTLFAPVKSLRNTYHGFRLTSALDADAAHAGVVVESLPEILPVLETHLAGHRITSDEECRQLGEFAVRQALQLVKPVKQQEVNGYSLQIPT